ncbi:MAG: hypothetical protein AB8B71_02230 [Paracoccaceae bacterium]
MKRAVDVMSRHKDALLHGIIVASREAVIAAHRLIQARSGKERA